jgi:hypothetical protein
MENRPTAPQPDRDGILTDEGETKYFTIRHMDAKNLRAVLHGA